MSIDSYDPTLNVQCESCEDTCTNDGCRKLFALGPCSTIINDVNPANGAATLNGYVLPQDLIFDANTWCRVTALNNVTYNPNVTIRKKGYVGECYETTKLGQKRPTFDVDIDYCRFEDSHCMLNQHGCLVAFMCMEDREEFVENVSPTVLPNIRYGIARIEPGPESFTFDEEDNRTFTLHVHRYFWEFNMCQGGFHSETLTQEEQDAVALTLDSAAA